MVKHDREFEILLKEFLKTEGKHFSSKEEATKVFERIYNLVDADYEIDASLSDLVDAIDEGNMSVVDKISALRELHEGNRDALDRAVELEEDVMYSDNDEDAEQMIIADVLAEYYSEAGMNEEAAKLYELMLMANPSDFHEVVDLLTFGKDCPVPVQNLSPFCLNNTRTVSGLPLSQNDAAVLFPFFLNQSKNNNA